MARCGWSLDLSSAICDRAMFHADNAYFLPAVEIVSYRCRTNTVSNTAFRGFGGPQGMLGVERVIDEIAHALGLDPLDVRRNNFYEAPDGPGERVLTPYHMTVEDCVTGEIVDELVECADYRGRRAEIARWNAESPILKRGIALTPVKFGISFTTTHLNQAGALVHIYQDGSVMLNHGGVEMGQGLFVKVAQVAASELSIDLDRVRITATRTDKVPNTSATAASSGSDINGMAVRAACAEMRGRLVRYLCENHNVTDAQIEWLPNRVRFGAQEMSWDELAKAAYLARVPLSATGFYATPKIHWDRAAARGRPFYYFAYGAAVSEAVIDTLTGENRLLRVDILHDVGRSLNPAIDLGQVEGGFIQGAGWLMTEELWWDGEGRLRTHAPSTYKIPCASDRPPVMNIALWSQGHEPRADHPSLQGGRRAAADARHLGPARHLGRGGGLRRALPRARCAGHARTGAETPSSGCGPRIAPDEAGRHKRRGRARGPGRAGAGGAGARLGTARGGRGDAGHRTAARSARSAAVSVEHRAVEIARAMLAGTAEPRAEAEFRARAGDRPMLRRPHPPRPGAADARTTSRQCQSALARRFGLAPPPPLWGRAGDGVRQPRYPARRRGGTSKPMGRPRRPAIPRREGLRPLARRAPSSTSRRQERQAVVYGAGHVGRALVAALAPLPFRLSLGTDARACACAGAPPGVEAHETPLARGGGRGGRAGRAARRADAQPCAGPRDR